MRHTLRAIVSGEEACCNSHPYAACGDALKHIKTAFDAWSEPEDESALSEKEGKNRGCC